MPLSFTESVYTYIYTHTHVRVCVCAHTYVQSM